MSSAEDAVAGGRSIPREGRRATDVALVALWRRGDSGPEILLTRRPEGVHLAGSWELPGGKIEAGESPIEAARRELREETGLAAADLTLLGVSEHDYGSRVVRLHAFLGETGPGGVVRGAHRWQPLRGLRAVSLPPANAPVTEAIERALADRPRSPGL